MSRSLLCLALIAPLAVVGCQDSLPMGPPGAGQVPLPGPSASVTTDAGTPSARIVATGELSTVFQLSDLNLEGADITVTYVIPDLSAGPEQTFTGDGFARADFENITMVVDIENRPDGAPDLLGLTASTALRVWNRFWPSTADDVIVLDSRTIGTLDGVTLLMGGLSLPLDGTQEAIDGTGPVSSLEFLPDFGPEFTPLNVPSLQGGFFLDYVYELTGLTVRLEGLTPVEQLQELAGALEELEAQGFLNRGQSRSLVAKLDAATARLNDDNTTAAANQLGAFVNEVEALVSEGILTPEHGHPLIDGARAVIDDIS